MSQPNPRSDPLAEAQTTPDPDPSTNATDTAPIPPSSHHSQLEDDLLPSPPATPSTSLAPPAAASPPPPTSAPTPVPPATTVTIVDQRDSTAPQPTATAPEGSTRIYRFPAQLPGSSASTPKPPRVVTVRDLKTKSCWICAEEDEDEPLRSRSQPPGGGRRRRRFIHPCNCTLVAHESCLLAWIDQSRINHPLEDTVKCPQCKAPYILVEPQPLLLKLLDRLDKLALRLIPIGAISVLGSTLLVATTAYGCVAIRLVLGREASQRALASPWPWHYWFDVPLIPFALIASKLRIAESAMTWLPTIVAYSLGQITSSTQLRLMDSYVDEMGRGATRRFPPSPALTAILVPWVRVIYLSLKRRVYRAVLSPLVRRARAERRNGQTGGVGAPLGSTTAAQHGGAAAHRRRRVIVVGNDNYLQDADPLRVEDDALGGYESDDSEINGPGASAGGRRGGGNTHQNNHNHNHGGGGGGAAAAGATQTIIVTHNHIGRLCLGALSLPVVANWMGKLLALLARRSGWLARLLGMDPFLARPSASGAPSLFSSFYTTARPGPTGAVDPRPSPVAGLFRGQLPSRDDPIGRGGAGRRAYPFAMGSDGDTTTTTTYDDLEPVWFRNAVGAGLFIVLKDAAGLVYRYLKLRQRGRTSVADLPFGEGLVPGLELKE